MSGEYVIAGDGRISFPLLGMVRAAGLTLNELALTLTHTLGGGYLLHPHVGVEIASYRPVYILGEVSKPGQYPYSENLTIYALAAQAGGFTYRANRSTARIRHEGSGSEHKYHIESSTAVYPGDTIRILERYF
jgi:protein involved in polysaccharide export with SLBB domain